MVPRRGRAAAPHPLSRALPISQLQLSAQARDRQPWAQTCDPGVSVPFVTKHEAPCLLTLSYRRGDWVACPQGVWPQGRGPEWSPGWSPDRASERPEVTQQVCAGAEMSPRRPLGRGQGLSCPCGDLRRHACGSSGPRWVPRRVCGCHSGLGALAPRGRGCGHPPSCGCNWFSPLSPPSLSAVFLADVSVPLPGPAHPLPPPFCRLRLSGAPRPPAFPSPAPGPACFLAVCPRR